MVTGVQTCALPISLGPILGPLFRQFPDSTRELVKARLVGLGKELLLRELPGLVQALNFRELISEKIDALDLLQLEQPVV